MINSIDRLDPIRALSPIVNAQMLTIFKVSATIWIKMIKQESDFDRCAVSSEGAKGPMKLMPGTAEDYHVKKGQKIAQVLVQPICVAEVEEVQELSESSRGQNGFGSTGA